MTTKMTIDLSSLRQSYVVQVGSGLLSRSEAWLPKRANKIVIITDSPVKKLYGLSLASQITKNGRDVLLLSVPAGERSKTNAHYLRLIKRMVAAGCSRDSLILALGGGVVGDLAGFIAATYMRGLSYIQIPTTLLAMVDSSIGGKTAIDIPQGKNLVGAFWHPRAVIADGDCLKSLSQKQWINGLIEVVKIFLVKEAAKFYWLDENLEFVLARQNEVVQRLLCEAIQAKAEVVQADEQEQGLRMILNFGHTLGHGLEVVSHYQLLHGYAVAYGILIEAKISQLLGHLDAQKYEIISNFFRRLGIEASQLKKINVEKIIAATVVDKKARQGCVHYVILRDIGQVAQSQTLFTQSVPEEIIRRAYKECVEG